MHWSTRDFSTRWRSAPTVPLPSTATSRLFPAIGFQPSPGTGSRLASTMPSPMRSRSEAMRSMSAVNISSATNPIKRRGCHPMPFSTCMRPIRSTRHSSCTRAPTTFSTTAMRPTGRSSIPPLFLISPMAARLSPTRARSARPGRAPSTQG